MNSERRIAIVGAPQASYRAELYPWKDGQLPNAPDYDLVLLDMRSLAASAHQLTTDSISAFHTQLGRVLRSGGEVVAIVADPTATFFLPTKVGPQYFRLSDLLPIEIIAVAERGVSKITSESNDYAGYLSHLHEWQFHFDFRLDIQGVSYSYATNREGRFLAGEILLPDGGKCVVLPACEFDDPSDAIHLVLTEVLGAPAKTPPPVWAESLEIPGVDLIDNQIQQHSSDMERLRAAMKTLTAQRESLLEFRGLLFADGLELEGLVKRSLELLGGSVIERKYGTEEFILDYENSERGDAPYHLIEVKGLTKSAALTHVRQLFDNLCIAEESTGGCFHGLLIANAFRLHPPADRGKSSLVEFPPNVVQRAGPNNIALITTSEVLDAVIRTLKGESNGSEYLEEWTSRRGPRPRSIL